MTRLIISVLVIMLVSLPAGVLIDIALSTSPWGVILSMLVGMSISLTLIVRYFNRSFSTLAPPADIEDTSERF